MPPPPVMLGPRWRLGGLPGPAGPRPTRAAVAIDRLPAPAPAAPLPAGWIRATAWTWPLTSVENVRRRRRGDGATGDSEPAPLPLRLAVCPPPTALVPSDPAGSIGTPAPRAPPRALLVLLRRDRIGEDETDPEPSLRESATPAAPAMAAAESDVAPSALEAAARAMMGGGLAGPATRGRRATGDDGTRPAPAPEAPGVAADAAAAPP